VFTGNTVAGSTFIEYFDVLGNKIHQTDVPVAGSGLSFAGASFDSPVVARVRVTAGTLGIGQCDQQASTGLDCVAMDDFFYGEPKPVPTAFDFQGAGDVAAVVSAFKTALGSTDGSNNGGSPVNFDDGFRQINWDPPPTVPFSDDKQALFPGGRFGRLWTPLDACCVLRVAWGLRACSSCSSSFASRATLRHGRPFLPRFAKPRCLSLFGTPPCPDARLLRCRAFLGPARTQTL
jgi:hypothetical protein